jgi:hypothetical protein
MISRKKNYPLNPLRNRNLKKTFAGVLWLTHADVLKMHVSMKPQHAVVIWIPAHASFNQSEATIDAVFESQDWRDRGSVKDK